MNELYPYGIQTENSDIRAHVSVVNRIIYVFPTENGRAAIALKKPPLRTATQPGVNGITADGWLVDISWIPDLRRIKAWSWPGWHRFSPDLTTTEKGRLAIESVMYAMQNGKFPLWLKATEDRDRNIQIAGTDILLCCKKHIQVKCDYRGGDKPLGTGNLFLQRAERNPLRCH